MIGISCSRKEENGRAGGRGRQAVVPVVTTFVGLQDVPLILPAIGNVQARATVTVRPQVGGKLEAVHFAEGDMVKQGDLLFTIDPKPFEVALAQANAALEQARAEAANAAAREERYRKLDASGSVSVELVEQVRTASATAITRVNAADSQVQQAQLELDYCRISAPLTGRAGRLLLDPGNIVQANLTDLTIINEIQPIEVSFTLAGRHLPALRKYSTSTAGALPVSVTPEGDTGTMESGTVAFFDNTVRTTTGTIEVRALFPNESKRLWPGQFTDVQLRLTETKGALTVPSRIVQAGQSGSYVYVIQPDRTAEMRTVQIERVHGTLAIVSSGLKAGEEVVLEGHSQLSPNAKVEVKPATPGPTKPGPGSLNSPPGTGTAPDAPASTTGLPVPAPRTTAVSIPGGFPPADPGPGVLPAGEPIHPEIPA